MAWARGREMQLLEQRSGGKKFLEREREKKNECGCRY
jgi:hypothetical protein